MKRSAGSNIEHSEEMRDVKLARHAERQDRQPQQGALANPEQRMEDTTTPAITGEASRSRGQTSAAGSGTSGRATGEVSANPMARRSADPPVVAGQVVPERARQVMLFRVTQQHVM